MEHNDEQAKGDDAQKPKAMDRWKCKKGERAECWKATSEPNLLKNVKSGRFYTRLAIHGKTKWIRLNTDVLRVAIIRNDIERAKARGERQMPFAVAAGRATMQELAEVYRNSIRARPDLKKDSKKLYEVALNGVIKTWPRFLSQSPSAITEEETIKWRDRVAADGTGFIPKGAKGRSRNIDGSSPSNINKMIDALRHMLASAVKRGQLVQNPLLIRGLKLPITPKKPVLPEADVIEEVFTTIESRGGGTPRAVAELCRFLAYSGPRVEEAWEVRWSDVNFKRGFVHFRGTKTKSSDREVPLIPALRVLLMTMRDRRLAEGRAVYGPDWKLNPNTRVLLVRTAEGTLTRACREVGGPRLTHHDLRDVFTTAMIEEGVPIPTVAAWLGHADGGALLLKVYSHVRNRHSIAEAAKIQWGMPKEQQKEKGEVVEFRAAALQAQTPVPNPSPSSKLDEVAKALGIPVGSSAEQVTAALAAVTKAAPSSSAGSN
jgi:integrase